VQTSGKASQPVLVLVSHGVKNDRYLVRSDTPHTSYQRLRFSIGTVQKALRLRL
jgi:hypothetical protein